MKLKAVLFDFNGVIVDDEPLHQELILRVLAEEGLIVNEDVCRKHCLGVPDRACLQTLLQAHGRAGGNGQVEALIARKAEYYLAAFGERDLLFAGVDELIRRLALDWPLALVSGALRNEIAVALARYNLRDCFRVLVASEDVAQGKPHPDGYLQALAALNVATGGGIAAVECLVIEDSLAGVAAAKSAGMRCLAVASSYSVVELRQADWVVESLSGCDPAGLFNEPEK